MVVQAMKYFFCLITMLTWKILLITVSMSLGYLGPKHSTEDGYERSFGVNYLGHFYLTYLLKDLMAKCAPSRIINVTSDSYVKGKLEYDDLPMKNYDMYKAYARSKLALMHFTVEAHRLWYPDVVMSYAVQPGNHLKFISMHFGVTMHPYYLSQTTRSYLA